MSSPAVEFISRNNVMARHGTAEHITENAVAFTERTHEQGTPIAVFVSGYGPFTDYSVKAGSTTGEDPYVFGLPGYLPNLYFPTTGHVEGYIANAQEEPVKVEQKDENINAIYRNDSSVFTQGLFVHTPEQLDSGILTFTGIRSVLRQNQPWQASWFVGSNTLLGLAERLARPQESPDDIKSVFAPGSRLGIVTRHPLFALKAVSDLVGLDIESVDEVKARVDTWRDMTQSWIDGHPETVEFDSYLLRESMPGKHTAEKGMDIYPKSALRYLASLRSVLKV